MLVRCGFFQTFTLLLITIKSWTIVDIVVVVGVLLLFYFFGQAIEPKKDQLVIKKNSFANIEFRDSH